MFENDNFCSKMFVFVGGLKAVLTDQNKLIVLVGGVTALAAGVYTSRLGSFS